MIEHKGGWIMSSPHVESLRKKLNRRTYARITKAANTTRTLRTYGVALQSKRTCLTIKCKHKKLSNDCKAIGLFKKTTCLCGGHITGAPMPAQIRGSQISPSLNHMSVASIIIPPACEKQRKARDFDCRKQYFT